ncbi:MAG: gliding motility-associated protein GldE, partial [Bacteroidota bacterium]
MDPGPFLQLHLLLIDSISIVRPDFAVSVNFILNSIALLILLIASGFISGAETAFFAITPAQLIKLKEAKHSSQRIVYQLLNTPKRLLAVLLITINFINIAIVVVSSIIITSLFNFSHHELMGFLIQVVAVTFLIVLFCEVMPKVYATQNAIRFAAIAAIPVFVLDKALRPLSAMLVSMTSLIDKRVEQKGYEVSVDELTHAIDITSDKNTPEDEKKILKGIARFGHIDVKQIMKPRMDVVGFEKEMTLQEIIPSIIENRYSRIPVYEETFDTVLGVLYI